MAAVFFKLCSLKIRNTGEFLMSDTAAQRKPKWLRSSLKVNLAYNNIRRMLEERGLYTVCQEARCPNQHECWAEHATATFMILGRECTRNCAFCAVKTNPRPAAPDADEPQKVAQSVSLMKLRHAVITSVTRDDLPDWGAAHFAAVVRAVRENNPDCAVEVLPSDMGGVEENIKTVIESGPKVFNHNIETVKSISSLVRPQADYRRSLCVLESAGLIGGAAVTIKSGLMVGLGESRDELEETFRDLRAAGVSVLTIGQYLRPGPANLPVSRYYRPEEFDDLRDTALSMGFSRCQSGALVRSSYHAADCVE